MTARIRTRARVASACRSTLVSDSCTIRNPAWPTGEAIVVVSDTSTSASAVSPPARARSSQLREIAQVLGGARRGAAVLLPQHVERRSQVPQSLGRHVLDLHKRIGLGAARAQVRGDAGADVDRDQGVGDRVVQLAGDAQPLLIEALAGLCLAVLLFAHSQRPAGAHGVADHEGTQDEDEPKRGAGQLHGRLSHAITSTSTSAAPAPTTSERRLSPRTPTV